MEAANLRPSGCFDDIVKQTFLLSTGIRSRGWSVRAELVSLLRLCFVTSDQHLRRRDKRTTPSRVRMRI